MYDTFGFDLDDGGFSATSLLDVGLGDAFDPDFGVSPPRVKLPTTTPLDLEMELSSTETPVVGSWALGSPVRRRSSLSRSASLEFAFGKVKGLKRDASLDKIFVTPGKMATWGQDSSASSATDAPAIALAPAAPTAPASPLLAPAVPAPPKVAPAARVTASAAPTRPETAPAPPKNKNKRKTAQKKGRKARAEDDVEDDAAATAQSNTKTARAAGTTQRSGAAATRAPAASSQTPSASSQAPSASSRAPSASTRAQPSTARASAADDAAPSALKTPSMAGRRAAKAQRAMQSLRDASVEVTSGADTAEATRANASGSADAITQDAANITPSPTRTPPPSASTTAPVFAPTGANERATAVKGDESSNLPAHVGVTKILLSASATQSSMSAPTDQPPHDELAQQLPPAPMQSVPAQSLAHYAPPAPAHGYLNAQVPQSVGAAPRTRVCAHGDVRLTPSRTQTMPDIDAFCIAPTANAFYPPHAPAYQGPVVPAPWYHNVVLAAQPHAMINGQPMLPLTMPPPPYTMYAPQVQHLTNAPAPANGAPAGAYHVQQASSTQHGLWVPPNYPTSTVVPASAPYYNPGAPAGASGPAYPPMRAASNASSSRTKTYTSFVDSNGMTRVTSPFPQRASGGVMPGSSSGAAVGNASRARMDPLSVAKLLSQSNETGIPDGVRKVVEEQFPEIVAKMREQSSAWALPDTAAPPPSVIMPNRDFTRGEPIPCLMNHGRDKPPCSHVFMVDRSQLDDDAYKSDYEVHVLEHLEHPRFTHWACEWKGCDNLNNFMGTKNGIGHHVAEHIFKELKERIRKELEEQISKERKAQILRERKEQSLKELQDLSGQPAPKRARHH
ncbi:hypothetical protein FB107DRAFT_276544 [Schizophyllum commune]